jgi:periplasmic protein TonB
LSAVSVTVDSVLAHRRRIAARSSRLGVWTSLLVHGGFIAALVAAPLLRPEESQPIKFVSVALVSAQALGVRDPAPVPAPAKTEAKAVPAEPAPPPKPATKPEPTAEKPKPQPTPSSPPTATQPATSAPAPAADSLRRRLGSPTGSATGTAAFGARVGFDNPNFKHSYYIDQMTAMLAAQWQRPALGGEVTALVHFTIRKDGVVSDIRLVESSGYSSFDLAALRAVQQAAPFPPLPHSYDQATLGVTVEFI